MICVHREKKPGRDEYEDWSASCERPTAHLDVDMLHLERGKGFGSKMVPRLNSREMKPPVPSCMTGSSTAFSQKRLELRTGAVWTSEMEADTPSGSLLLLHCLYNDILATTIPDFQRDTQVED